MRNSLSNTSIILTLLFCCVILTPQQRDLLGDVNNDGEINVLDIVRIVNIIMENDPPPTEDELWASDVNADETTNVQDIVIIVQVIMESDDCPELYSPCSDNFSLCCMDITSHDINWEIDTLGVIDSFSRLSDVAVFNENNIWVVGEIRTEETDQFDSTGTWMYPYNLAKWNGVEWNLDRISFLNIFGNLSYGLIKSIYAFNENDIWVTVNYGSWAHFNGVTWETDIPIGFGGGIEVVYGISPDHIYFIGTNGAISFYDGDDFHHYESITDVTLKSISGTGPNNIWVSGEDLMIGENMHTLLHYDGVQWDTIINGPPIWDEVPGMISGVLGGVYADDPDTAYVITHLGLYKVPINTNGEGVNQIGRAHV